MSETKNATATGEVAALDVAYVRDTTVYPPIDFSDLMKPTTGDFINPETGELLPLPPNFPFCGDGALDDDLGTPTIGGDEHGIWFGTPRAFFILPYTDEPRIYVAVSGWSYGQETVMYLYAGLEDAMAYARRHGIKLPKDEDGSGLEFFDEDTYIYT